MARRLYRYEKSWYALRGMRSGLIRLARAGDQGAVDALRDWTLHAGVFAALSVHNSVVNQEREYAQWLQGLPMKGLAHHVNSASNVGAWIASSFDVALYRDRTGHTLVDSLINIRGLGPAKATFMGALLAYDRCPCIDTHMARKFGLPRQYANLRKYREAIAASPLQHTLTQWEAFLIVPQFALTMHDIYFDSVLPIAGYAYRAPASRASMVSAIAGAVGATTQP